MRLTQAAVVAFLALTVAANPLQARDDSYKPNPYPAKCWDNYGREKACDDKPDKYKPEDKDKHHDDDDKKCWDNGKKVYCKDDDDKKCWDNGKKVYCKDDNKPKPPKDDYKPNPPPKDDYKPNPPPKQDEYKPNPPPKNGDDGYKPPKPDVKKYTFDDEITLKCEGGHIVITGKGY
ncbi:hypothetical protein OPT61_g2143 [Boeremia exigua]|uniref:Uncharacterized protein n=1 Tax=Boeremia exigua TaxID=749465 RepID=A0ACC2IMU1_9PLEO|nr:hypothetical protein OPT61_g2143 [Boeremia exigua]